MHEYSVCRALLDQVERLAEQHGAGSVARVHLIVGEFAGVDVDLLRWAFESAREGTVAGMAELEVESRALRARCDDCRTEFDVRGFVFTCPRCASVRTVIVCGEELILDRVTFGTCEVEKEAGHGEG